MNYLTEGKLRGIQNKIALGMSACATCRQDDCYNCSSLKYPEEITNYLIDLLQPILSKIRKKTLGIVTGKLQ